jgi:putative nucleotidyltransferase with HDIG domain
LIVHADGVNVTDSPTPLARMSDLAEHPSVSGAVDAVRDVLGMAVAYVTRHTETEQVFETVSGDGSSFGFGAGTRVRHEYTYCRRVLAGELPNLMRDVRRYPAAREVPGAEAAGVGAYCAVPLVLSDGQLYGTLCCASHEVHDDLGERDLQFLKVIARLVSDAIERDLVAAEHVREQVESASVQALLAAVEARDGYTGEHSRAVVTHAVQVAEELGLPAAEVAAVRHAATLHDVGKIGIPDAILRKPGRLTSEEWDVMREHPVTGARIVECLPGLAQLTATVRAEHERWDGNGYPDGLRGEEIPLAARIVLVCDAYHAMTSDRPYRQALGHTAAVAEIRREAGHQFCPGSAAALLTVLERRLPLAA